MIFVYPKVLLLIIFVFLLVFFHKSKKIRTLENVFSKEILEKLEIKISKVFGKNIQFYFSIISLILMMIALARPIILDSKDAQEVKYQGFNLAVVLDISKSMQAKDIFPNRLAFAKKSLNKLMENMSEASIAVIAYAQDAFLVSPFSNDFKSINFLVSHLDSYSLSTNGSQIPSALKAVMKIYKSTNDDKKSVLLISDGADGLDMSEIGKIVKDNNIILNILNIGTKKGITLDSDSGGFIKDKKGNIVISKRDDSIAKIAQSSGGAFVGVSNDMSKISWLAKEIRKTASKRDMKKDKYEGAKELFYYPLALAVGFLFFVFNSIRVIPIFLLFFINTNLHAGMLDFLTIKQANKSYSNKEYKKAAEGFSKLNFDEATYNKANALYKEKKYKDALENYKKIKSFKGQKELQRLYDMGNSNAKLKQIDKAIKNYEDALKINKNDEDTKFNLELLKKQKKKKKNKQQNKKQKKKNKKDKNKQNKNDKKNKQKNKNGQQKNKEDKKKKSKKQEKGNTQSKKQSNGKEEKKMSEAEAKKWEKKMNKKEFKTKPYRLEKSTKGNKNEITW